VPSRSTFIREEAVTSSTAGRGGLIRKWPGSPGYPCRDVGVDQVRHGIEVAEAGSRRRGRPAPAIPPRRRRSVSEFGRHSGSVSEIEAGSAGHRAAPPARGGSAPMIAQLAADGAGRANPVTNRPRAPRNSRVTRGCHPREGRATPPRRGRSAGEAPQRRFRTQRPLDVVIGSCRDAPSRSGHAGPAIHGRPR